MTWTFASAYASTDVASAAAHRMACGCTWCSSRAPRSLSNATMTSTPSRRSAAISSADPDRPIYSTCGHAGIGGAFGGDGSTCGCMGNGASGRRPARAVSVAGGCARLNRPDAQERRVQHAARPFGLGFCFLTGVGSHFGFRLRLDRDCAMAIGDSLAMDLDSMADVLGQVVLGDQRIARGSPLAILADDGQEQVRSGAFRDASGHSQVLATLDLGLRRGGGFCALRLSGDDGPDRDE